MIGASLPRPDAIGKVTGATDYPGDLIRPNMIHLALRFADRPHARVTRLDPSPALAIPGVIAVLNAADVPFNGHGLIDADQPVLCGDVVRCVGDRVALVAAETSHSAALGAAAISVAYEDLPILADAEEALSLDAPFVQEARGTNLLLHVPIRRGDATAALAVSDVVLEGEFTTPWQEHAYLQPEAGIAELDPDDRVVVTSAGQWLHDDRRQIAAMLRLPEEQIIVRYAAIGGAFGGREDLSLQHLLALATWKLRRPVAMVWDRATSIRAHHKRHPFRIRCRWGANRDGTITAVEADLLADGGAYASTSVEVLKCATLFATGCYAVPNVSLDGRVVLTNNVPSGAFRGFGAPQAQFAAEEMVARLAEALGIDPIEFRRRNLYREGDIEPTGQPLPPGVSVRETLDACVETANANGLGSAEHTQPRSNHIQRGVGFACGIKNLGYSFGYPEQATATVEAFGRGEIERVIVRCGAADVGQGSHVAMRQIAAASLDLNLDQVELISDDSADAPNAGSASASRLTLIAGRAVHDAAREVLAKWPETDAPHVTATVTFRPTRTTELHPTTGAGTPNHAYAYAAQAVEVEVNTVTGQVRVARVISAHDVGRVINRQQVEGQIEGALAQALGYTLMENFQMADGQISTPSFATYLIPTSLDMPDEIIPVILELADPVGPFGARGVAELPLVPFPGAVADAIHDAIGIWLTDLPFTPERVLTSLLAEQSRSV